MDENTNESPSQAPQLKPLKTPLPTWLRPMTGIFSVCAGVLYGLAAVLGWAFHRALIARHAVASPEKRLNEIEKNVETGVSLEDATELVDAGIRLAASISTNTGILFSLLMALLGCLAMLMVVTGVGLIKRKIWSLGMGRICYLGMIIGLITFFVSHHSAFHQIGLDILDDGQPEYGVFTAVRMVFLLCMCPLALLMGNILVVKQLRQQAAERSAK